MNRIRRNHVRLVPGLALTVFFACLASSFPAAAQSQQDRQRKEQEVQAALAATEELPRADRRATLDWGAWYRLNATAFSIATQSERRLVREHDLRAWAHFRSRRASAYVRGKTLLTDYNPGDAPDGNEDDFAPPELDRAYITWDISAWASQDMPRDAYVHAGRQYLSLGSGLALSNTFDAAVVEISQGGVDFMGFGAATAASQQQDIDLSLPGGESISERTFTGFSTRWNEWFRGFSPYLFILFQRDRNDEDPVDTSRDYGYDSEYVGAGATGQFFLRNLRYEFEYIHETGRSHTANSSDPGLTNDIDAHAAVGGLELLTESYGHPRLFGRYAFGSGDPDRASVDATSTGHYNDVDMNTGKTRRDTDRGFLPFGYTQAGLALNPKIANLKVISAGLSMRPFEAFRPLRELEVGGVTYLYEKVREEGGISDLTADLLKEDVGKAYDLYLHWNLTSDFTASLEYGSFSPGDAYSRTEDREYLNASLVLSF